MTVISRGLPSEDSGATLPFDGKTWQNQAHAEVVGLWDHAPITLENVSGVNTIAATADVTIPAYRAGMSFYFKPANNNSGPVTINIDELGAVDLLTHKGVALAQNDLLSDTLYQLYYDGTSMLASGGGIGQDGVEGVPTLLLNQRLLTEIDSTSNTAYQEVLVESFNFTTTEANERVRFDFNLPIAVYHQAEDTTDRNAAIRIYLDGDDYTTIGEATQWNGEIIANTGQWCRNQNVPVDNTLACSVEKTIATAGVHTIRVHSSGSTTDVVASFKTVRNYQVTRLAAIKGDTGAQGMVHRGAYSAGTDYLEFDAVSYEGSTWIARIDTTGNAPPTLPTTQNTQWNLVAQKGDDGTGVPTGGTTGQVLAKASGTDGDVAWIDLTIREALTANRTYYVRTDGNDSNTGLADTSGAAFLTIQKAIDTIATLDLGPYAATVSVGAGTFTGAIVAKNYVGVGPVTIDGAGSTTIISTTSASCFSASGTRHYAIKDVKMQTTTGGNGISATSGASVEYQGIEFGAVVDNHVFAASNANVSQTGTCTVTGGATCHLWGDSGARINVATRTITLSGTPAFGTAFAQATMSASISAILTTLTGSATGTRYNAANGGVINTNAGGASFFPGSVAGTGTNFGASPWGLYV